MLRLKELRLSSGKTQQSVADYLNISRASYTNIENGKRDPDTQTLIKLAELFSVSIDCLVGRENENQPTANGDGLDEKLVNLLVDLSPSEIQRVRDFVSGLKASRKEESSPQ